MLITLIKRREVTGMDKENCDLIKSNRVKEKKFDVIEGYTIKYHANGSTVWSKGKVVNEQPEGYWEWYRIDGTLKRSGYFDNGEPIGEWITYDSKGERYKSTQRAKL
jgi:antitoxin component YwqK of YwqJK toxin-antitoxin module